MRKLYAFLFMILCCINVVAQSVYMHEAQNDAEESGASGFDGIFKLLIFIGIVFFICKIWPSKKKDSSEDYGTYRNNEIDDEIQIEDAECRDELEEMELISRLDKEDEIEMYNTYDYTPIKGSKSTGTKSSANKPKYHPCSGDEYFDRIICEREAIYYPEGSIEDRLKGLLTVGMVDLGLSVLWSSKNIGANKIYDNGYFFRWGSLDYIENYDPNKILEYSQISYPKEIENLEIPICGNTQYDAACKFSNGLERLPKKEEFDELIYKCNWQYIEIEKYKGFIITGPSGNSIYLPMTYHSFVNPMYQMMMSVGEAYLTGTPNLDNEFDGDGKCTYCLGIANKNHDTKDFNIVIASHFKKRFCPIRSVSLK